jgi:AcrR family transcriptional regulator
MSAPASKRAARTDWHAPGELPLTPILRAALDAFADKGYHATSVRDIAGRVHVTVPTLYYHHANKEAILFALLDTSIDRLLGLCEQALTDSDGTPEGRFLNLVECIVVYMANAGKSANLDIEIRALSEVSRRTYSDKRRVVERMLVDTIAAGDASGVFSVSSPEDTARALLGMYQAIPRWFNPRGRLKTTELARRYKDISAHAVGGDASVLSRACG